MDFIQDPLLWPKLITRYRATHTIAPHFGYQLTARRMELAGPELLDLDLSSLTFLDYPLIIFFGCWCSSRLYTVFSSNWVINPDQGFYIISGSDSHCVRNFQGCSWWRRTNQCAHPAGNVAYLEALWSTRGGLLCCLWRPGICWNIGFQKLSIFNSRLAVHDSHQLDLDRLRLFSKPGHCRGPIRWCYIAQSSMLKNGKDTKYPRCHVQYHSSPSWKKVGVQEVLSLIMSRV